MAGPVDPPDMFWYVVLLLLSCPSERLHPRRNLGLCRMQVTVASAGDHISSGLGVPGGGSLRRHGEASHDALRARNPPKLASQVSGLLCESAPLQMASLAALRLARAKRGFVRAWPGPRGPDKRILPESVAQGS